jgi:hypothetical protein
MSAQRTKIKGTKLLDSPYVLGPGGGAGFAGLFPWWLNFWVVILIVSFAAVAKSTTDINKKAERLPVWDRERIPVVDTTDEKPVSFKPRLLAIQLKWRKGSNSRPEGSRITLRQENYLLAWSQFSTKETLVKPLLKSVDLSAIIPKRQCAINRSAWGSYRYIESGGLADVLQKEIVREQSSSVGRRGWNLEYGRGSFNFNPSTFVNSELLNTFCNGISSSIRSFLRSTHLKNINDQKSEGYKDSCFFPPWTIIPSLLLGFWGIGWGWDSRRLPRGQVVFWLGSVFWCYGFSGFLFWLISPHFVLLPSRSGGDLMTCLRSLRNLRALGSS